MTGAGPLPKHGCARIATLTLNPTIDTSMDAEKIVPTDKIRTHDDRLDPGGGGINVARVLVRFGAPTHAIFMAGGSTGGLLDRLLQRESVERTAVPIAGETRVSVTVYERSTGQEYRFVPEGPVLSDPEWQDCLKRVGDSDCQYFVASGSLPRGVPADFYARLADKLAGRSRFVLDTSGDELKLAVAGGDIFLLKASRDELAQIAGTPLGDVHAIKEAASRIVADGLAQNVAVTLGADGALLATADGAEFMAAIPVEARSTVGAGDSFLAAMTYAFASGADRSAALRLGIAAGAAATLSPGTNLCHPWDVTRLAGQLVNAER